jgi:outer membrane protein OmpA-like peptidoglycan-associated protein
MPLRFTAVVLLAGLALPGCREPTALRESDEAAGAEPPAAATPPPVTRPVATLGPDDAVPRTADPLGSLSPGTAEVDPAEVATVPTTAVPPPRAAELRRALDATGTVVLQLAFDPGQAALRADAMPIVNEIAALLRGDPALKLSIEGHTDNLGDPGRNRELSDRRAEALVAALAASGIDPPRLDGVGFGGARPIADNATAAGRAQNRRIELRRVVDVE